LDIQPQPDETTCGPTCLHAIYRYYDDDSDLDQLIAEVPAFAEGGTLAVFLACHALRRGYRASIYTYNLHVFDPTWFSNPDVDFRVKLTSQARFKCEQRLQAATRGYLEFFERGGLIRFEDLTPALIRRCITKGRPVLTGLSATYLYRTAREHGANCDYDDVQGTPAGHFVVLCGYESTARLATVADPLHPNPLGEKLLYAVGIDRVIGAIMLGVLTHDANLLILEPPRDKPRKRL